MANQQQKPWRVVLLTDFGALMVDGMRQILDAHGHKLVGILTSPGAKGRGLGRYVDIVAAAPHNVDVIVSNFPRRWAAMLAPLRPDLIVSSAFPWIIPDDVIALPSLGSVNMHGGLLPQGRGPNGFGWAFRNGDAEIGLTIHWLDSGLDTGPILAQIAEPTGDDDMETIFPRLEARLPDLWSAALARITAGDPGDVQDESQASYASVFEEDYRAIDWTAPARETHNQVRAWMAGLRSTVPGAIGIIDGEPVRVLRSAIATENGNAAIPGTVLDRDGETLTIQCGDGALRILRYGPVAPDRMPV